MTRHVLGAACVAAAAMSGCRTRTVDYFVQVRNETGVVIRATITKTADVQVVKLHETILHPQERKDVTLARRPRKESLEFQVNAADSPAPPTMLPLSPGPSIFEVTRAGDRGPVSVELLKGR